MTWDMDDYTLCKRVISTHPLVTLTDDDGGDRLREIVLHNILIQKSHNLMISHYLQQIDEINTSASDIIDVSYDTTGYQNNSSDEDELI